jgi:hypothetical protein
VERAELTLFFPVESGTKRVRGIELTPFLLQLGIEKKTGEEQCKLSFSSKGVEKKS